MNHKKVLNVGNRLSSSPTLASTVGSLRFTECTKNLWYEVLQEFLEMNTFEDPDSLNVQSK